MEDVLSRLKTALADRYSIEHELGAGAMATVHLALDLKHKRKVAIKVLRPELAAALGHERFLSPEQAAGDPIDVRSDQYSLGCVVGSLRP